MKNKNLVLALLITGASIASCKKKETTSEENTNSTTTTATQPHVNAFTANVNGQNWSTVLNFYYTGKDSNGFMFGGQSASSSPYSTIKFNFAPAIGTFTFNTCCPYKGVYSESASPMSLYTSQTGTINIMAFDTTSTGLIKTFKATFGFETIALGTQSYVVTSGNIDYIKP